jgi:hypothetical protein
MANESESKINDDAKEELTPEERIAWLRERVRHRLFASFLFSYICVHAKGAARHIILIGTSRLKRKTTLTFLRVILYHDFFSCLTTFDCLINTGSIGGNVRGKKGDGDKKC